MVATPEGKSALVSTEANPTSLMIAANSRGRSKGGDRIGQVAVGLAIAGHRSSDERQHVGVPDSIEEEAGLLGAQELEDHRRARPAAPPGAARRSPRGRSRRLRTQKAEKAPSNAASR